MIRKETVVSHVNSCTLFFAGSNHYGIAGWYAMRATKEGLLVRLGLVFFFFSTSIGLQLKYGCVHRKDSYINKVHTSIRQWQHCKINYSKEHVK